MGVACSYSLAPRQICLRILPTHFALRAPVIVIIRVFVSTSSIYGHERGSENILLSKFIMEVKYVTEVTEVGESEEEIHISVGNV